MHHHLSYHFFFIGKTIISNNLTQYSPQEKLSFKLKLGDEEITEEGTMFSESTFIS